MRIHALKTIKPIKNDQDYVLALGQIEHIFNAKPNTLEGDLRNFISVGSGIRTKTL